MVRKKSNAKMTNSHVAIADYLLAVLEVKMNKIIYAIIPVLA